MKTLTSLALEFSYSADLKQAQLKILDQTLLPFEEKWIEVVTLSQMVEIIQSLRVRGAPLIGVAASLMLAKLAIEKNPLEVLQNAATVLYESRPTAVNLMICIDRMRKTLAHSFSVENVVAQAVQIFEEDVRLCDQIAQHGASLIADGDQILTHCNTGGLATAGVGTALGIIQKAFSQGKKIHVYVDETRPLLQGGRLTTWELQKLKIPYTLISDNMAAHLMSLKKITKAIVGSDRIAVNGDFANKIGTYSVAVNCFYHEIPFYVAAPYTTVDSECLHGNQIPIEQRKSAEVLGVEGHFGSVKWALPETTVYNPSFDVTPAKLVTAWVLDRGVFYQEDVTAGLFKKTNN